MIFTHSVLFNSPFASLGLILLIPLVIGFYLLHLYRRNQLYSFAIPKLIHSVLISRSQAVMWTKWIGWLLIWILCCFALMEPFGNLRYPPLLQSAKKQSETQPYYSPHEVIFLVDTSASMGVHDGFSSETRLEEAKKIMLDILRQLHGQTVSLYAFTSILSTIVPPTLDYLFLRLSIGELHLDEGEVGGTLFASVLKSLSEQVFAEPSFKRYSLVLLSDGGDTHLEDLKVEGRIKEMEYILSFLPNSHQFDFKFFVVGMGKSVPEPIPNVIFRKKPILSKLEPLILKSIAETGNGKYYAAQEWKPWDLAREIINRIEEQTLILPQNPLSQRDLSLENREDMLFDLYYQIPLGVAIFFYFITLLLPDVRRL